MNRRLELEIATWEKALSRAHTTRQRQRLQKIVEALREHARANQEEGTPMPPSAILDLAVLYLNLPEDVLIMNPHFFGMFEDALNDNTPGWGNADFDPNMTDWVDARDWFQDQVNETGKPLVLVDEDRVPRLVILPREWNNEDAHVWLDKHLPGVKTVDIYPHGQHLSQHFFETR